MGFEYTKDGDDIKLMALSITKDELTSAYMTLSGEQDRKKAEETLAKEMREMVGPPVSISKWLSNAANNPKD